MPSDVPHTLIQDIDDVSKAMLVHLQRPLSADYGSTKIYLQDIIAKHPDLAEFIHEHVSDIENDTENVVLSAMVFEYAKVQNAFIRDAKFEIVSFASQSGRKMDLKKHTANIMARIKGEEVIN